MFKLLKLLLLLRKHSTDYRNLKVNFLVMFRFGDQQKYKAVISMWLIDQHILVFNSISNYIYRFSIRSHFCHGFKQILALLSEFSVNLIP